MKRFGRFAAVGILAATATLLGCEGAGTGPGAGGGARNGPSADGGAGCAEPGEGCPCEPGTEAVDCYTEPVASGGEVLCGHGTRYCRGGTWSTCEDLSTYALDDSMALAALIDGPTECNPCNPHCSVARDYPGPGDLTPGNSSMVTYDPAAGGIVITAPPPTMMTLPDGDGDGVPDTADSCPGAGWRAPCDGSAADDGFYHTLPFGGASAIDPLVISTQVRTADVYFLMDTTGSMGGEITNLRASLTSGTFIAGCPGGIIGAIQCTIPDAWFGVGGFDDYPVSPYGGAGSGDLVYYHRQSITSNTAAAQTAVNGLALHWGNDWPESQSQALWAVATGGGLGPYLAAAPACPSGRWGYPCFRPGTIPIVIMFTDAPFHNGPNPIYDYGAFGGGGAALPPTTAVAGNDTMATARATGDAATTWTGYTGTTAGLANNYAGSCASNDAPDAVFSFTVSATTTITISLEGSSYDTLLYIMNSGWTQIACNDDAIGLDSRIVVSLTPGTYYAVVDGFSTASGAYRLSIGNPTAGGGGMMGGFPVSWADAVTALTARGVKVITVNSGGSVGDARNDCVALANATGSTDSGGAPFVFDIPGDGSGLSTAVVNAVRDLANYSRMDVTAVARDNPVTAGFDERAFVNAIRAVSYPAGRCMGMTATTFQQCLPGTMLNFEVTFRNDVVMPTMVAQVFDFTIDTVGDGVYVLSTTPVRIVVPPVAPMYPPEGRYSRDYDATTRCAFPAQRPDWNDFDWTASTPAGTSIRFEFQTATSVAGLAGAPAVFFTVPPATPTIDIGDLLVAGGQPGNLPYVRVTAVLQPDAARTTSPVLTGFTISFTCVAGE